MGTKGSNPAASSPDQTTGGRVYDNGAEWQCLLQRSIFRTMPANRNSEALAYDVALCFFSFGGDRDALWPCGSLSSGIFFAIGAFGKDSSGPRIDLKVFSIEGVITYSHGRRGSRRGGRSPFVRHRCHAVPSSNANDPYSKYRLYLNENSIFGSSSAWMAI